jgi:hypothetical protein
MTNRPIAVGLAVAALAAVLTRHAHAQIVLAAGPSLAFGAGAGGGMHAKVSIQGRLTDRVLLRATGVAHRLSVAIAIPSCIPEAPRCDSFTTPYPESVISGLLALVIPTRVLSGHLYALTGAGVHHGSGYKNLNDRYGTTAGVSAGVGLATGGVGRRGIGIEAEYHQLIRGLGDLQGILVPSVVLRF